MLALLAACAGCGGEPGLRIVLVTLDTLRYDRFAGGAEAKSHMPRLRQRAARGATFTRLYAATPLTQPTHATLLTGLHPWEHGVTRNGQVLAGEPHTVAELLRDAGFETGAVVASFPVARRFGFARGFDQFREEFTRPYFGNALWEQQWVVPEQGFYSTAETITAQALAMLDGARAPRQFFWFHYFDAHSPYGVSVGENLNKYHVLDLAVTDPAAARALLERVRALYDADVESLDASLDRLLARLETQSSAFETHVFIVSDHGESLGEGGSLGHGWRLSEEELHVPALLLSPRALPGPRDDVAGSIDVAATLLALAGIDPGAAGFGGRDLLARPAASRGAFGMRRTFAGESAEELRLDGQIHRIAEPLAFFAVEPGGALASGDAASVEFEGEAGGEGGGEGGGSGAAGAERIASLFASFEASLARSGRPDVLDPETEQALRALGYLR